jgi:hypothetical protein
VHTIRHDKTGLLDVRTCPYCSEECCGAVRMFWHLKDNHIDDVIQGRIYEVLDKDVNLKTNSENKGMI